MIREELQKLAELQEIDSCILDLEEEINSFPEIKNSLEQDIKKELEKKDMAQKEYKRLLIDKKEKELELEGVEGEIKKLQVRLNEVKTNKEYTVILAEINALKSKKLKTEDAILLDMEKEELLTTQLSNLTDKNDKLVKNIELKIKEAEVKVEQEKEDLKELKKKREEALPSINSNFYSIYERILKGHKNRIAICRLEESSCTGCRVFVPTYIEEKVKAKKEIVHCENCSRILY